MNKIIKNNSLSKKRELKSKEQTFYKNNIVPKITGVCSGCGD